MKTVEKVYYVRDNHYYKEAPFKDKKGPSDDGQFLQVLICVQQNPGLSVSEYEYMLNISTKK